MNGGQDAPPAVDGDALLALPPGTRRRRELQPLLYAVLEREDRLSVLTAEERALARQAYFWSIARTVPLRDTLRRILDAAEIAGVDVLPLKGSLLAFAVYPDPAMRPMADVDIAVRPEQAEALAARIVEQGYRRHGEGRRRYDLERTHHLVFTRPKAPLVELHVRLVHELGADGRLHDFFDRAIQVDIEGRRVLAPSWEDHAFYVALHAATHGLADSPLWLIDLAHLMPRVGSIDALSAAARSRNALAALHFAFEFASRYFPAVGAKMAAPTLRPLRAAALRALLGSDPLAERPDVVRSLLLRFALTDRAADIGRALVDKTVLRIAERLLEPPPGT